MNILKVEISVLENSVIVSDRSGQKSSSDLNFRQKRCRKEGWASFEHVKNEQI